MIIYLSIHTTWTLNLEFSILYSLLNQIGKASCKNFISDGDGNAVTIKIFYYHLYE